jgi:hypothetical protein
LQKLLMMTLCKIIRDEVPPASRRTTVVSAYIEAICRRA